MQLSIQQMRFLPYLNEKGQVEAICFYLGKVSDQYTFPVFRAMVTLLLSFIIQDPRIVTILHSPQNITLFLYTEDTALI